MSTFTVSKDDLLPRTYERLPNGKYRGTLAAVGKRLSQRSPWEGVELTIEAISTPAGETKIQKGDQEINLAGQTRRVTFTSHYENEAKPDSAAQTRSIGRQQITGVAWALGLVGEVDDGDGNIEIEGFEFESTDDAVEQLEAGIGLEVGFTIKVEPRKMSGEVQKDDSGNIILDDNIKRIFPVSVFDD
jgi:hypothetical protein